MQTTKLTVLTVALLLVAACAPTFNVTVGNMPGSDPGATIEAGMTTKSEVVQLFGKPDFKGVDEDGLPRWTWTHLSVEVKQASDATITSFFNLEISFDGDLVKSYSYSKKAE